MFTYLLPYTFWCVAGLLMATHLDTRHWRQAPTEGPNYKDKGGRYPPTLSAEDCSATCLLTYFTRLLTTSDKFAPNHIISLSVYPPPPPPLPPLVYKEHQGFFFPSVDSFSRPMYAIGLEKLSTEGQLRQWLGVG